MPTLAQAREAIRKKEARGDIAGASAIRRALEERGLSTVTDSELEAQRAEQRERLLEQQLQSQLDYAESQRGSLARGIDIGTDIVAQATGSALEGIGGVLGLEGLEQYGAEVALENEADAQRKARFQTRFDDIEGAGSFGSYLGGIAAESAPQMGATLAGGIAGAKVGSLLGPIGAGVGALVGGAAASLPFFYGMNRERQKEAIDRGLKTEVDEGAAALTAIPQATLDAILGRLFVGRLGLTNRAIGGGGIFTRGVKGTAAGAVTEAPTELGQQVLERAQAGLPLTSEDAIAEYREAAIAGGLLGGTIRGTATVAGGDVAAREDAQKVKEERDAAARRAEMEAALDEEAVEPPTIPEDAPAGTQGRLFDDAPPVVETTTEEAVEEGAPPVVDDEAKAAADIVSETVIEREGQPTEVITQTRAEFEAAVEEAQQKPEPRIITEQDLTIAGFKPNAAVRKRVTGKDLNDPKVRADLVKTGQKFKSQEVKAGVDRLLQGVPSEQRDLFTDTKREPDATGDRERDAVNISSVESTAVGEDTAVVTGTDGRTVGDVGGSTGQPTTGTGTEPDTLTEQDIEARKYAELGALLEKEVRTSEEEARLTELVSEAKAGFARRQKPPEGTREASLEFEEGAVTEEQAAIDAETEAQAAELSEAITNLQQANALIEGRTSQGTRPVRVAPSLADPDNIRTQQIREFHADRVTEAKELGEKPPTLAQSRDEFTVQEGLDPNVRRIEGVAYSATEGGRGYKLSRQLEKGYLTEQELITERDNLLKGTVGKSFVDALKYLVNNSRNPFEKLLATNIVKLVQRMESAGFNFDYKIVDVRGNIQPQGFQGLTTVANNNVVVSLAATNDALARDNGVNHQTLLHEGVHAVTLAATSAARRGRLPDDIKLKQDIKDLFDLFDAVKSYFNSQIAELDAGRVSEEELHPIVSTYSKRSTTGSPNFLTDGDELLAWGLTDSEMQDFLDTVPYNPRTGEVGVEGKGTITLWEALVNALRKLLKLPPKDNTALNELLRVQNNLLAPDEASLTAVASAYGAGTAASREQNPALVSRPEETASQVVDGGLKSIPVLTSKGVQRVRDVVSDSSLTDSAKSFALSILSLNGLEMVAKKYVPKISRVRDLVLREGGRLQEIKRPVDATINKITAFARKNKDKVDILNRIMPYSSLVGVDPSKSRKTYEEEADKLAEYDAMHAADGDWTALGEDGQRVYKVIRNAYKHLYDEVARVIKVRLDATELDPKKRKNVYDELINKLYKNATIDPYFPLIREGRYRLEYTATDPKTGQAEYFTESFETKRERREAVEELQSMASEIKLKGLNSFEGMDKANYNNAPAGSFVNNVLSVLKANEVEGGVQDEIVKLFLDTLPERSFAQSFRRREGYRGFIGDPANLREAKYPKHDMVRALRIRTASTARQIVRMEFGAEFQKLESELEKDFEKYNKSSNVSESDKQAAKMYLAEVAERIKFAKNPDVENWAKNLTTFGFAMTLGLNLSSVLVNFSQIPMVIAPHLASTRGDDGEYFGYSDTVSAIGEAVRLFKNAGKTDENTKYLPFIKKREAPVEAIGPDGTEQTMVPAAPSIDNYNFDADGIPPEIKEFETLAKVAEEQGQLNRSIMYDTLDMEEIDSVRGKIGAVSGFMFHHGERMTRQVALAAAYRLKVDAMKRAKNNLSKADFKALSAEEKANLKLSEAEYREAAEFAVYEVELTNGGTAAASAPRIGQQGIGKVAFLYKRYGVQMMELLYKLSIESIRGTPAEKAQARRQLAGVFGGSALVAGAQGLPMYGVAAMVYDLFKGDEDEDFDTVVRKTMGEELFSGMGNAVLGVDVASRMGLSDLIFRDRLIEKDQPFLFDLFETIGGPVYGVSMQMERGYDKAINQGELMRGVEAFSPAAIRNVLKTVRFYEEGARTQRGDIIVDDISAPLLVMQFFGFAPAEYTRQLAENAQLKKISGRAAKQRTNLLRKYYAAVRSGDTSRARRIRESMNEFNQTFPNFRITPETIKRSMTQHMRTSKRMHYGVTINPKMMADMQQSAAEYDDTLTIWDNLGM